MTMKKEKKFMLRKAIALTLIMVLSVLLLSCEKEKEVMDRNSIKSDTWGAKLGFPMDRKVLILHADDMGMCPEANQAGIAQLEKNEIQSAAIMAPCPNFEEFAQWYKANPSEDVGIHLTLTSEWKTHRWGPVSDPVLVPGLIDPAGYLWHSVPQVVMSAKAEEIEKEIRAQIEKSFAVGIQPSHIDTHMGTLYGSQDYAKVYMKIAMEYNIPAMVIEFTDEVVARFREEGYPITDDMINFVSDYPLPKLDNFQSVTKASSYEEKKENFFKLVNSLQPGITEIIFHPSIESDSLKNITNSWQQRVWEGQMFADPDMKQFFQDEKILFTNWKDMMKRFKKQ
jgi:predicted glycoside hydrolase/deacetylase ChbG (UPF0249 family)